MSYELQVLNSDLSHDDQDDDLDDVDFSQTDISNGKAQSPLLRWIALLCACSLGIGSHYAYHVLGPLKSTLSRELGMSDVEFGLLISALGLNGTWTPLVAGVMVGKLGTTLISILATGVVFFGQALVLLGDLQGSVRLMVFGLFIFGLGTSPLSVVQESIIVQFFSAHSLGVSMALGLITGKGVSFVSARTSYPLAARFGRHAPFIVSTALTGLSFVFSLVYALVSNWPVHVPETSLDTSEVPRRGRSRSISSLSEAKAVQKVAEKHYVNLNDVLALGDVFWTYIGLNVICGMVWGPFTPLAPNIFERRYELDEADASRQASYALLGSLVLYPACGYLVDRFQHPQATLRLFMASVLLTMMCYAWLVAPPQWTRTPLPGVASFALGVGFGPLLLVVIVPALVPLKYVSTVLGMHGSLEHAGSTTVQMLAGLWLDKRRLLSGSGADEDTSDIQYLLWALLLLNVLQFLALLALAHLHRCRGKIDQELCSPGENLAPVSAGYVPLAQDASLDEIRTPSPAMERQPFLAQPTTNDGSPSLDAYSGDKVFELRRGRIFACICVLLICCSWLLFIGTAWFKLRPREEIYPQ